MSKTRPLPKKPVFTRNDTPLPDPFPVIVDTWVDFKPEATEEEKAELVQQARILAVEGWLRQQAEANPDGEIARTYFRRS